MTARIPLLLAVRLRLAPRWAASRLRRNPAPAVLTAGITVLFAAIAALVLWTPPAAACHLRALPGRDHWTCTPAQTVPAP